MKKRGEYYITQFFYLNLQTLIFIGKMKQLKFLMVALTLLMGISFTSCLNSDDGEYDDIYGMVLVNNYMGLLSLKMLRVTLINLHRLLLLNLRQIQV